MNGVLGLFCGAHMALDFVSQAEERGDKIDMVVILDVEPGIRHVFKEHFNPVEAVNPDGFCQKVAVFVIVVGKEMYDDGFSFGKIHLSFIPSLGVGKDEFGDFVIHFSQVGYHEGIVLVA